MKVKELKRELSKLSGLDFFNPKYRDVFKKYFPDETGDEDDEARRNVEEGREDIKSDSYDEMKEKRSKFINWQS